VGFLSAPLHPLILFFLFACAKPPLRKRNPEKREEDVWHRGHRAKATVLMGGTEISNMRTDEGAKDAVCPITELLFWRGRVRCGSDLFVELIA
jgi:hypothetical protein